MNDKINFLHNHLDYFPEKLGVFNEQHGERFHSNIKNDGKKVSEKLECQYDSELMLGYDK